MKRLKEFLKTLIDIIWSKEMVHLPGSLAFFIVLSIFPVLTLIGYLASYFSVSVTGAVRVISHALPSGVDNILLPFVDGKITRNALISIIFTFILASNGAHALILASNSLYGIKNSSYLKRRVKALFLIILMILLFIFMIAFLTYGNILYSLILSSVTYEPVNDVLYYIFTYIKWPIAMVIIFFIMRIVYMLSPDGKIPPKTTSRGAMFTTLGFTIATAIFSFYVANFSAYDIYYGSISTIVVLMMWVYIISYVIVIGIAINVRSYNKYKANIMNNVKKNDNNINVL